MLVGQIKAFGLGVNGIVSPKQAQRSVTGAVPNFSLRERIGMFQGMRRYYNAQMGKTTVGDFFEKMKDGIKGIIFGDAVRLLDD